MAGGIQRSSTTHSSHSIALPTALALILLTIGLTFSSSPASAANGWELILDRPTPSFGGMDFVSNNEGWLVAGAGILHTTDGGATWQEAAKITAVDVDFADADHGWLVGHSGQIWGTSDGGETWEEQDSETDIHLGDVAAVGPEEAWIVGSHRGFSDVITFPTPGAFLHTTDGGSTWTGVDRPADSWFREIVFVDGNGWALGSVCEPDPERGYCAGNIRPLLLHSPDGGATWSELAGVPEELQNITFADANNGWAAGRTCATFDVCSAVVYRTSDGGVTWRPGPLPALDSLQALAFRDAQQGWLIGESCFSCPHEAWSTADGGSTWTERGSLPTSGYIGNLHFFEGTLYAYGNEPLRSSDGGESWEPAEHPAMLFTSLSFGDPSAGYATSGGQILRSGDAGRNWTAVGQVPGFTRHVLFLDRDVGFAMGGLCCAPEGRSEIYRTEDGGKTWQRVHRIESLSNSSVRDAEFVDEIHGWFALEGGFLFTRDGGRSWREEPLPEDWSHLVAVDLAGPDVAWVIASRRSPEGLVNRLFRTADGGQTWETTEIEEPQGVEFVDPNHGWYQTRIWNEDDTQTKIYATEDGGANWELVNARPRLAYLTEFTFVDAVNGWLIESRCDELGCTYEVLHTADGGRTWSGQLSGELLFGDLQFIDAETGWFLLNPSRGKGIGGGPPARMVIYRTTDGGGGPIGVVPTPTVQLPDVGSYAPTDDGSSTLPLALLLAGFTLALGTGGLALVHRRSRG